MLLHSYFNTTLTVASLVQPVLYFFSTTFTVAWHCYSHNCLTSSFWYTLYSQSFRTLFAVVLHILILALFYRLLLVYPLQWCFTLVFFIVQHMQWCYIVILILFVPWPLWYTLYSDDLHSYLHTALTVLLLVHPLQWCYILIITLLSLYCFGSTCTDVQYLWDWMICRHKSYHFTVANLVLPRRVSGAVKRVFATVKWYDLCLQIIQISILIHSNKPFFKTFSLRCYVELLRKWRRRCFHGINAMI